MLELVLKKLRLLHEPQLLGGSLGAAPIFVGNLDRSSKDKQLETSFAYQAFLES